MAIAAQRFKFLDNETNIPIPNLNEIVENAVFNIPSADISEIQLPEISDSFLESLTSSLEDIKANLESFDLSKIVDKAISAFENLELPDFISDALDFLKNLDFSSLKGFFSDILDIGANFLCNNLDFLKLFLLGFAINGDILGGLLIAFLLSLLDRICDSYLSKDRVENSSNKEILDTLIPAKLGDMTSDATFNEFKQCMGDMTEINSIDSSLSSAFDSSDFVSSIIIGTPETITSLFDSLKNNDYLFSNKNVIMTEIENQLPLFSPTSQEYSNLLFAKGILSELPAVSPTRSLKNILSENISFELGKLSKKLSKIEINPIKSLGLDGVEKDLFNKFVEFKQITITERDIFDTRELKTNSFIDIDFGNLVPSFTDEIKNHLKNTTTPNSHRWRDISPTTEILFT